MIIRELIKRLRQFPTGSLVAVLDCGEGEGIQITTPDGEDEIGFIEVPTPEPDDL